MITLHSNLRWSYDVFEVSFANGEAVRVAFAIDCCDREIIGYVAASWGISSSMVQDLMLECVEKRFRTNRAPHPVQ